MKTILIVHALSLAPVLALGRRETERVILIDEHTQGPPPKAVLTISRPTSATYSSECNASDATLSFYLPGKAERRKSDQPFYRALPKYSRKARHLSRR